MMFFLTVLKSLIIFKQGCCIFSLLLDCVYCVDCPSYPGLTICSFLLSLTEKAMTPHSSTLAWKIPWTEEPGRLQSMGRWGSDTTERLSLHFSLSCIGGGNGNALQCSCLENPGTGEPGGLLSMGSHRVRHDWSDLAAAAATVLELLLCCLFLHQREALLGCEGVNPQVPC